MKPEEFSLQGGLTFKFPVPETVEEYDALAGRKGACAESAVDNIMYRGPFARIRDLLAERVEKTTGIERGRKPHPNKEKAAAGETVYAESPAAYISRATPDNVDQPGDAFQGLLDELMAANAALADNDPKKIVFDPSERVAKARTSEPSKSDFESAKTLLQAGEALPTALERMAAIIKHEVVLEGDEAAQLRTLALAFREYRMAISKVGALLG